MATRIALLNAGRVEQVGTPAELYDRPRSAFVAGFLGAPPANLFPAVITGDGGRVRVVADGIDIELPIAAADFGADTAVTAGIRPEHLRIAGSGGAVRGRVTMVENLGSEELVHLTVGARTLCLRAPRPAGAAVGDDLCLDVDADRLHLFHPESGLRMRWQSPRKMLAA